LNLGPCFPENLYKAKKYGNIFHQYSLTTHQTLTFMIRLINVKTVAKPPMKYLNLGHQSLYWRETPTNVKKINPLPRVQASVPHASYC
jgi:hypothetical protein